MAETKRVNDNEFRSPSGITASEPHRYGPGLSAFKKCDVDEVIQLPLTNSNVDQFPVYVPSSSFSHSKEQHCQTGGDSPTCNVNSNSVVVDMSEYGSNDACDPFLSTMSTTAVKVANEGNAFERTCSSEGNSPSKSQQRATAAEDNDGDVELGKARQFFDHIVRPQTGLNQYCAPFYEQYVGPGYVPGYTIYGRHSPTFPLQFNREEELASKKKKKMRKRPDGNHTKTEEIPGFRGYLSVESLLQYIEGSVTPNKGSEKSDQNTKAKKTKSTPSKKINQNELFLSSCDSSTDAAASASLDCWTQKIATDPVSVENVAQKSSRGSCGSSASETTPELVFLSPGFYDSQQNASGLSDKLELCPAVDDSGFLEIAAAAGISLSSQAIAASHSEAEFIPVTSKKKKRYTLGSLSDCSKSSRPGQDTLPGYRSVTPPAGEVLTSYICRARRRSADSLRTPQKAEDSSAEFDDCFPEANQSGHHRSSVSAIDRPTYASVLCQPVSSFKSDSVASFARPSLTESSSDTASSAQVQQPQAPSVMLQASVVPEELQFSDSGTEADTCIKDTTVNIGTSIGATSTANTGAASTATKALSHVKAVELLDILSLISAGDAKCAPTVNHNESSCRETLSFCPNPAACAHGSLSAQVPNPAAAAVKKAVEFLDHRSDLRVVADLTFGYDMEDTEASSPNCCAPGIACAPASSQPSIRPSASPQAAIDTPQTASNNKSPNKDASVAVTVSSSSSTVATTSLTSNFMASKSADHLNTVYPQTSSKRSAKSISPNQEQKTQFSPRSGVAQQSYIAKMADFTGRAWAEFTSSNPKVVKE